MSKLYGSLQNRLFENKQFCDTIEVGTGVTEYGYSDRYPYEVIEVTDQKHVKIRALGHNHVGDGMDNKWELFSDENNSVITLVKRGKNWYREMVATIEDVESDDVYTRLWVAQNGFDADKIREKSFQKKYHKMNVSFGTAEYYYDYEF